MKREKRLTKRERKTTTGAGPSAQAGAAHIHCIACGRHLDATEFTGTSPSALYLTCEHRSRFPACRDCQVQARFLISEHDRTGNPVQSAQAWH